MESYNAYLPYCLLWGNPLISEEPTKLIGFNKRAVQQQMTISFYSPKPRFLALIPENSLLACSQGHTPVTLWQCLHYGCSLSLPWCFFCLCNTPVMLSPYIHMFQILE